MTQTASGKSSVYKCMHTNFKIRFIQRVREARSARGVSIEQMALQVGALAHHARDLDVAIDKRISAFNHSQLNVGEGRYRVYWSQAYAGSAAGPAGVSWYVHRRNGRSRSSTPTTKNLNHDTHLASQTLQEQTLRELRALLEKRRPVREALVRITRAVEPWQSPLTVFKTLPFEEIGRLREALCEHAVVRLRDAAAQLDVIDRDLEELMFDFNSHDRYTRRKLVCSWEVDQRTSEAITGPRGPTFFQVVEVDGRRLRFRIRTPLRKSNRVNFKMTRGVKGAFSLRNTARDIVRIRAARGEHTRFLRRMLQAMRPLRGLSLLNSAEILGLSRQPSEASAST